MVPIDPELVGYIANCATSEPITWLTGGCDLIQMLPSTSHLRRIGLEREPLRIPNELQRHGWEHGGDNPRMCRAGVTNGSPA